MPIVKTREYRAMTALMAPVEEQDQKPYRVRGYAATWDDPYLLFEFNDEKIYEKVDRNCLESADLSDVIMQFDHAGRVYARTSNGTLKLGVDNHGLWVEADLSTTASARELYEEIRSGLITKMSWAFTVREDHYDEATSTRIITKIKKVYDVSAVSYPANPDTEISARAFGEGVITRARRESLMRKIRLIELNIKLEERK